MHAAAVTHLEVGVRHGAHVWAGAQAVPPARVLGDWGEGHRHMQLRL